MKKLWVTLSLLIGLVLIFSIWWILKPSASAGVYPEKHAGSVVLEIKDDESMLLFQLPVRWIKSHPWEDSPIFEDIKLLNKDGTTIASINGQYQLKVDPNQDHRNNHMRAEIEFYINGESFTESNGISTKQLSDTLLDFYLPEQLIMTSKGETYHFSMKDTYKIIPIQKKSTNYSHGWNIEGMMPFIDEDTNGVKGFVVELEGPRDSILEDILFWLPGMPDDYLKSKTVFSMSDDMDQYLNNHTFEGKPLTLPLKIESDVILIYFPITADIEEKVNDSYIHLKPYFKFENKQGMDYVTGGSGSTGQFDKNRKFEHLLIEPE